MSAHTARTELADGIADVPNSASITDRARRRRGQRTQAERSAAMRQRIQEATLECLSEAGYMGTSFASVAVRAGVSRGALQHHYRNKAFLIAGALEMLVQRGEAAASAHAGEQPGPARAVKLVDGFWIASKTPPLPVIAEVRVASHADAELREILQPVEHSSRLRQREAICAALGPELAGLPETLLRVDAILATIRGLIVQLFYQGWDSAETEATWSVALADFGAALQRPVPPDENG